MQDIQVEVRRARLTDVDRIQQLIQRARRSCIRFGYEDLLRMIERDYCFIADTGAVLWGFICATSRQRALAQIRGFVLVNGWRLDIGVTHLLQSLEDALSLENNRYLMHFAMESWLVPPLIRRDFTTRDYIVNFERAVLVQSMVDQHLPSRLCRLRSLAPSEIGELKALDHRCFDWPWQFSSGELVQLLLTTSRLVVLEVDETLAGYACIDVHSTHAQIIRVGIDPDVQGQGFGRYLLADALDFAANNAVEIVTLNTQWHNQTSQRLYQGFGFRAVGRRVPVLIKEVYTP